MTSIKTIKVIATGLTDGSDVFDVLLVGEGATLRIPAADHDAASNLANDIFASIVANGVADVTLEI